MTLMAGLNHMTFAEESATLVRAQVKRALTEGGNTRFILAPGCSLPTYAYPPLIRAARDESSQFETAMAGVAEQTLGRDESEFDLLPNSEP